MFEVVPTDVSNLAIGGGVVVGIVDVKGKVQEANFRCLTWVDIRTSYFVVCETAVLLPGCRSGVWEKWASSSKSIRVGEFGFGESVGEDSKTFTKWFWNDAVASVGNDLTCRVNKLLPNVARHFNSGGGEEGKRLVREVVWFFVLPLNLWVSCNASKCRGVNFAVASQFETPTNDVFVFDKVDVDQRFRPGGLSVFVFESVSFGFVLGVWVVPSGPERS